MNEITETKLPVAKFNFSEASLMSWKELFHGFDKLEAITYSSSLSFMNKVLETFNEATIILGTERTMSMELNKMMAFQTATLQDLNTLYSKTINKKKTRIHDMIQNNQLRFWLARSKMSHEKLYLLSNSNTGNTRVIFGSANFSNQAFSHNQRELICYCDNDEKAFKYYKTEFEILKEQCCDIIPYDKIKELHQQQDIENLPFAQNIQELLIVEPQLKNEDEIRFVLDVEALSKQFKQFTPPQPKTKILKVFPETITKISRKVHDHFNLTEENQNINPEFIYDIENQNASYNGKLLDLNPSQDEIKNDALLFIEYMNGFNQFFGNTKLMQKEYYKFVVWFFCSPFIAKFRMAANHADKTLDPYPAYALIYGSSKAGKTTFVKTLYKMTFGIKKISHAGSFTAKQVEDLKRCVKGIPLFYDDIISKTFNEHAVKLVKHEDFGLDEFLDAYPCVVITGNDDVKAVEQYVSRRVALCHVTAGITNMQLIKNSIAKTIQKKIGTALYREYLRRMMERIPVSIAQIQNEENKDVVDLIKLSSEVLNEIFSEYNSDLPEYMNTVSLENYFDEHQTSATAIASMRENWKTCPEMFTVIKKRNLLQITFGTHNEAQTIRKQLPANLCPEVVRTSLRMKLDAAEEFFGMKFKKRWWG